MADLAEGRGATPATPRRASTIIGGTDNFGFAGAGGENFMARGLLPGDARDELDDDAPLRVLHVVERAPVRFSLGPLALRDLFHTQLPVLLQFRGGVRDAVCDAVQHLAVLLEAVAPRGGVVLGS